MQFTAEQYNTLMRPLNGTRIAHRQQAGRQLSYLESWDVRAHLIRIFGFGNFDAEIVHADLMWESTTQTSQGKDAWTVGYKVVFSLTVHEMDANGYGHDTCRYVEAAVGSNISPDRGDAHDNALKTAASDALKRCAINLGSQFGLSLYDNGSTREVVKRTLVGMPDQDVVDLPDVPVNPEQLAALQQSLGATVEKGQPEKQPEEQQA